MLKEYKEFRYFCGVGAKKNSNSNSEMINESLELQRL